MGAALFDDDQLILFQGDSITDCGRDRENGDDLGRGYASYVAARISAGAPDLGLRFLNRGISGNRAKDLRGRWQADCLDLKPDWVSILIGINDTWRRYDREDPTSADEYAEHYGTILAQCKDAGIGIIICEPFVLPVPEDRRAWREDLDPKIAVARRLAVEFAACYVPFDGVFAQASVQRTAAFWARDGVHPSQAGHMLMADAWLEAVGV